MEVVGKVRKWGNSLGVVLPKDFVKEQKLEEGDEVIVSRKKQVDLKPLFGLLKGSKIKMTAQEFKDEARKGWGD